MLRCSDVGGGPSTNTIHHRVLSSEQIKSRQEQNCTLICCMLHGYILIFCLLCVMFFSDSDQISCALCSQITQPIFVCQIWKLPNVYFPRMLIRLSCSSLTVLMAWGMFYVWIVVFVGAGLLWDPNKGTLWLTTHSNMRLYFVFCNIIPIWRIN